MRTIHAIKIISLSFILLLLIAGCEDKMDIKQDYEFTVKTMPVNKKIRFGETTEIRCRLQREGYYEGAKYFIRYFQPDGIGTLFMNGINMLPNDLYQIKSEEFRLYYISFSEEQQNIDLVIEDNFGKSQAFQLSFMNNNTPAPEDPGDSGDNNNRGNDGDDGANDDNTGNDSNGGDDDGQDGKQIIDNDNYHRRGNDNRRLDPKM